MIYHSQFEIHENGTTIVGGRKVSSPRNELVVLVTDNSFRGGNVLVLKPDSSEEPVFPLMVSVETAADEYHRRFQEAHNKSQVKQPVYAK
ncbi:MAG: hypothetical protein WC238_06255 [Parcubacteria group bacterium]|jgi:hypothetical protein